MMVTVTQHSLVPIRAGGDVKDDEIKRLLPMLSRSATARTAHRARGGDDRCVTSIHFDVHNLICRVRSWVMVITRDHYGHVLHPTIFDLTKVLTE